MILRDNDRGDCRQLKQHLRGLCAVRAVRESLIRIVCQELEAWFLGEPEALAEGFRKESLRRIGRRARFRNPDAIPHPASEIARLVPQYQTVSGARALGGHITRERNQSQSFRAMIAGIERFASRFS